MFTRPNCGWTEWEINGHKNGSVSYCDDVPAIFITACCNYLKNPIGFNLVLDGEGNDHGLSLIGNYFCAYSFHGEEPPYLTEITPVSDFILYDTDDGPEFVEKMLREAINDFERDFDLWSRWNPGLYEDEEEITEEADRLRELIEYGKETLAKKPHHMPELGNLIFGNSRGEYPVDRKSIEDVFSEAFGDIFSYNGFLEDPKYTGRKTNRGGYENDTFCIEPYYWGDDDDIAELPNFIYKPENIEISWYKYWFRDSYSNVPLDVDKAREIFKACRKSMDEEKNE